AVDIWVGDRLWGLLIAHQCHQPRHWTAEESDFLQRTGAYLSLAIAQSELHHQLQQQRHNLEECVVERTQDLRDAMVAAQAANRAKSEFLATMSHELRTPLTCIIGMSATLLRWSFGDLSPRQQNYLTTIHDSGDRLLALINDILEVSKIESGRTVLEISEFSLSSLARQCLDLFQDKAQRQGIHLALDVRLSAQQDSFVADPRRIKQILQNLLSNAVKFTAAEGQVILRLWREKHAAVLRVEDTGIGIPEGQRPLLFEKFQQLEAVHRRQYQGTGLGLALTKQLIDLHGGSITVESQVNQGSAFTVRLPLQRLSAQSITFDPKAEAMPEPVLGRVVLVEDDEETAGVICDMLTAADFQVIWLIDGSQVLEQVQLLQPMAVIVDMGLSGASGQAIIAALRQGGTSAQVKILALMPMVEGPDANAASPNQPNQIDADDALSKPIDPKQLLLKINALMALPAHP
ncbi:MAG: ATP-binding protein, partial [Cyanobacteria bacterium P01_C01_bin.73]